MNQSKNYYYDLSQEKIKEIKKTEKKPTLLLHSCCAPCNSYVMIELSKTFDVTLLYNNSNIYPHTEYLKRVNELKAYTEYVNEVHHLDIKLVEFDYDDVGFIKQVKHLADEPEGGKRCELCFTLRMNEAYQYALENDYDYFTTVMTISRQKNSITLNKIGESLNNKYESDLYFFSDFKKKDGLLKSRKLINDYGMYQQQYCGCIYSYHDYLKRKELNDG